MKLLLVLVATIFGSVPGPVTTYVQGTASPAIPRIVNGKDTVDGQFPYMVSLKDAEGGHICGGAIIAPQWVLTSATCCLLNNITTAYVGSVLLSTGGRDYAVVSLNPNKDYNPDKFWANDLCLIKVEQEFEFDDKVRQVTLPPQDRPIYDFELMNITGWGSTNAVPDAERPDRLQLGQFYRALFESRCSQLIGAPLVSTVVCTVGGNIDQGVCLGDNGGPLVENGVLLGINSFSYIPCGGGVPGVYASVSRYIYWIQELLGSDASQLTFEKELRN